MKINKAITILEKLTGKKVVLKENTGMSIQYSFENSPRTLKQSQIDRIKKQIAHEDGTIPEDVTDAEVWSYVENSFKYNPEGNKDWKDVAKDISDDADYL